MDDASFAVQILHSVEHLWKVIAGIVFWEASCFILKFNEWKEVSLLNKLEHDEKYLYCAPRLIVDNLALNIPINQTDDITVAYMLE